MVGNYYAHIKSLAKLIIDDTVYRQISIWKERPGRMKTIGRQRNFWSSVEISGKREFDVSDVKNFRNGRKIRFRKFGVIIRRCGKTSSDKEQAVSWEMRFFPVVELSEKKRTRKKTRTRNV